MKDHFPRSAGGDTPSLAVVPDPIPVEDRPRDLMLEVLRDAAAAYHEAERRARDAYARYEVAPAYRRYMEDRNDSEALDECDRWELWSNVRDDVALAARHHLILAVLAANGRARSARQIKDMGGDWPPCAFELGRVLYVVSQDPNEDREARPILTVLDTTVDCDADWSDQ